LFSIQHRNKSLRIALTITELDPGGAEQCLVHLAILLANRGHDVKVFALGPTPLNRLGASTDRSRLTDQLDRANIPWECGPARGMLSLPKAMRWLKEQLQQFQPGAIQSMLFHANVVTALANRTLACPHFGGARVVQPTRWRRLLHRWAASKMTKLVCVSQRVAEHCEQIEGIDSRKLLVIPNGVDLEPTRLNDCGRPQLLSSCLPTTDCPFVLFVGRLSEQKGILPLIEKADELLELLPNHHLVLLGDGPLRSRLEDTIQQREYAARIHLLGWQPDATLWMRHADLLLLPSLYEGMPNVVLEAMSVGCPLVCFDVEGIDELLGPANSQVISTNMTELIQRAHRLVNDNELRAALVQDNLSRVQSQFSLVTQLAKYEALYLEQIGDCLAAPQSDHRR
jgi:glycosyltransferase involved in cell wall biosynthesis